MGINIPNLPPMPTDTNSKNFETDMLKYKEASAKRQMLVQMISEDITQQAATRTNMMKAAHDVFMRISDNTKS